MTLKNKTPSNIISIKRKSDITFINMALEFAKQSKCASKQVCALIIKNDRIISSGLNGTVSGMLNCNEKFNPDNFDRNEHHTWSNENEVHAEVAAITAAARNGISIDDATIYCTLQPCMHCCKMIAVSGIRRVVYFESYDKSNDSSFKILDFMGISIEQLGGKN